MRRDQEDPRTTGRPSELGTRARSVQLTRFTIHPDRASELVRWARSAPSAGSWPDGTLLVALEDGDWLVITVTSSDGRPFDDFGCVDLADGISGDESGAVVALTARDATSPTGTG